MTLWRVLIGMVVPGIVMTLFVSARAFVWLDENIKSGPARRALDWVENILDLKGECS